MSKPSSSKVSKTDWKRVDVLRDEEIKLSDNPGVTPEMFAKASIRGGLVPAPPLSWQVCCRVARFKNFRSSLFAPV